MRMILVQPILTVKIKSKKRAMYRKLDGLSSHNLQSTVRYFIK